MGKKGRRGGQQKRGTTISLFEFNEDVTVGKDPELAELPSAPKLAEEWAALGGRPEYNHRGYKERERRADPYADGRADDDFDSRDWKRHGPVDGADEPGFGTGPERDWSGARRAGPLDAAGPERDVDFGAIRRGPVDAEFGGKDVDFGGARRGPVEAELGGGARHVDFGVRKGPVEAEFNSAREVDFGGARKGPVEAEFQGAKEVDFGGVRKGPVEAEFAGAAREVDFGGARKGPIEAEFPEKKERDFSVRKGPLDAEVKPAPARNVDFANMRRTPVQNDVSAPRRSFGTPRRAAEHAPAPTRDFGNMRRASINAQESAPRREFGRRASESATEGARGANAWRREGDWRGTDRSTTAAPARAVVNTLPPAGGTDPGWTMVRSTMKRAQPIEAAERKV